MPVVVVNAGGGGGGALARLSTTFSLDASWVLLELGVSLDFCSSM